MESVVREQLTARVLVVDDAQPPLREELFDQVGSTGCLGTARVEEGSLRRADLAGLIAVDEGLEVAPELTGMSCEIRSYPLGSLADPSPCS